MTLFREETGSTIPFLIAYVFPLVDKGTEKERVKLPDREYEGIELDEQAPLVIEATFGKLKSEEEEVVKADGIGFNCTSPLYARKVTELLSTAYSNFISSSTTTTTASSDRKPFFVLYPDGGAVYSVETRTWSHPLGLTDEKWADLVVEAMDLARKEGVWGGVIGGGCCKAGVGAIRALSNEVERKGWR